MQASFEFPDAPAPESAPAPETAVQRVRRLFPSRSAREFWILPEAVRKREGESRVERHLREDEAESECGIFLRDHGPNWLVRSLYSTLCFTKNGTLKQVQTFLCPYAWALTLCPEERPISC